jgi:hypothetical protein
MYYKHINLSFFGEKMDRTKHNPDPLDFDDLFDDTIENNEGANSWLEDLDSPGNTQPTAPITQNTHTISSPETNKPSEAPHDSQLHAAKTSAPPQKRSFKDFSPDMDALLLTAQSSLILDAMKYYTHNDFSPKTLSIYKEAFHGISVYVKILDRNPQNYAKLQEVIISDMDCQEVEKIAFDLFEKRHEYRPSVIIDKITAYEAFMALFKNACERASINSVAIKLKTYFHLSGGPNEKCVDDNIKNNGAEFEKFIYQVHHHLLLAKNILQTDHSHLAKTIEVKNLNVFIINASHLLYCYYRQIGDKEKANNYHRIHKTYKKWIVIR